MLKTVEDLFTQNTGNNFLLNTDEDLFTQNTEKYFMLSTVGRFTYTTYWEILSVEHYIRYFSVFCVNKSSQCST
jgi:hypothetical protein